MKYILIFANDYEIAKEYVQHYALDITECIILTPQTYEDLLKSVPEKRIDRLIYLHYGPYTDTGMRDTYISLRKKLGKDTKPLYEYLLKE